MHKTDGKQTNLANLLCSLLLGGLLALGLELLLLLLGAVVVSNGILSDDASVQIATAACVLGCFGGGLFVCRRWNARRGGISLCREVSAGTYWKLSRASFTV